MDALDFSRTTSADAGVANAYERGGRRGTLDEVDFYTRCVVAHMTSPVHKPPRSHEGLMLDYEIALTRQMEYYFQLSRPTLPQVRGFSTALPSTFMI